MNNKNSITLELVQIDKPEKFDVNVIIGTSHFIKTVEDIYEAITNVNPNAKFGLAFCEASEPRKIRTSGTDKKMIKLALKNAKKIAAGHSFVLFLNGIFPINIMHSLRTVPEILNILCATANPVQVIIAETSQGRGMLGVIDGGTPSGEGKKKENIEMHKFLQNLNYKFNPKK